MQQTVLLVTVTRSESTEPCAHGIYTDATQAVQQLGPGFVAHALFNKDGTRAGTLLKSSRYTATVSSMPLRMAATLVRGGRVWDVPDTAEAINA